MVGRKQGMVQGLALAVSQYLRHYGEHPGILEIWRDSGLSLQECIDNAVDEYDMETLRKYKGVLDK